MRRKKEMQGLIDASRHALAEAETKIVEKDLLIRHLRSRLEQLKAEIVDKDNNIEFLVNNLSAQKKKLARHGNQN